MQHLKGQRRAPPKVPRSQPRRPVRAHAQRCSKAVDTTGGGHHRSHRRAHHIAEPKASLPLVAGRCLWAPARRACAAQVIMLRAQRTCWVYAQLCCPHPFATRVSLNHQNHECNHGVARRTRVTAHPTRAARWCAARWPCLAPARLRRFVHCVLLPQQHSALPPSAQASRVLKTTAGTTSSGCRGQLDHRSLPGSTRTSRQDNEAQPCSSYAAAPWPGA